MHGATGAACVGVAVQGQGAFASMREWVICAVLPRGGEIQQFCRNLCRSSLIGTETFPKALCTTCQTVARCPGALDVSDHGDVDDDSRTPLGSELVQRV